MRNLIFRARKSLLALTVLLLFGGGAIWNRPVPIAAAENSYHFLKHVAKAPIVPDGNVAGAVTDLVIDLNVDMDPNKPGLTLLQGQQIRVTLPKDFINHNSLPLAPVFSSDSCRPGNVQCNTIVLLRGWPQSPLGAPPPLGYSLAYDGSNSIIITAEEDFIPNPPQDPGLKQLHLMLIGFSNPGPGLYPITVSARMGPDGHWASETIKVRIKSRTKPSINVVSVFNPGNPNTIYQSTTPGTLLPFNYDVLIWNRHGEPFTDITLEQRNLNKYVLKVGRRTVGNIAITAPADSQDHLLTALAPSSEIIAPILLVPTARMTFQFQTGTVSGDYTITMSLNNGDHVSFFVTVP